MNSAPSPGTTRLSASGRTDPGRDRSENQDSFLIVDLSEPGGYRLESKELELPPDPVGTFELGSRGALLLVADGMGGAAAGGVASELAVSYVHEELSREWVDADDPSPDRFAAALRRAVERANERLHERSRQHPALHGMGTTLTAVGVLAPSLCIAQVGDSRAYLIRRDQAVQLTLDQSVVQHLVSAGLMTELQARDSAHRGVLLQALGTTHRIQVELTSHELQRGDVILLCSDGLSGMITPDDLAAAVHDADDLGAACDDLVRLANHRGGPDNITVVIARFDGEGLEETRADDLIATPSTAPPFGPS